MTGALTLALLLSVMMVASLDFASAAPVSNVRMTKHNLSKYQTGTTPNPNAVKADTETQVCVFCHTPHAASAGVKPLWNRTISAGSYTLYNSNSMDVAKLGYSADQPAGSSLLCLSCHDGQVALGNVNVLNGKANAQITVNGSTSTKMPDGLGATTGFTRNLGTDLSNDHPISISYTHDVAASDKELQDLSVPGQAATVNGVNLIGIRSSTNKPKLPLEPTSSVAGREGQIECATCHDPHMYDAADPQRKFLRLNRLQATDTPAATGFNASQDIICLACHTKSYSSWGMSAHAKSTTADETYTDAAADLREFPRGTKVWQASCLNCHDMHTVQGSRRLLREGMGTDTSIAGAGTGTYKLGSVSVADNSTTSAIEQTCFQCHRSATDPAGPGILNVAAGSTVPAVKTLFDLPYGMPIVTTDQANGTREVHNIKSADMEEDVANLGYGNNANRHAECTDCHNPHRVRRSRAFYSTADADTSARTHVPGGPDGNMASGVLRGTWGVEPTFGWSSTSWPSFPTAFTVKKGDPGVVGAPVGRDGSLAQSNVSREYQLCFKCHSNYTNGETPQAFASLHADYAPLVKTRRTPTSAANGLTRYTNVAAEFGSVIATNPATSGTDQGEFANGTNNKGTACGGDCAPRAYEERSGGTGVTGNNAYNHRSWHPVVFPTGRDRAERKMAATGRINLLPPYKATIGLNTMHCSDCHGQARSWIPGQDAAAESGGADPNEVQGPHGSENPFLLRGIWTEAVNLSNIRSSSSQFTTNRPLCGNCHQPRDGSSGFDNQHLPSGSSNMSSIRCMGCHISLPHGWRNKAFLVNLRCVGTEVGRTSTAGGWSAAEKATPTDCDDWGGYSTKLDEEPYYYRSVLRVTTWQRSGTWSTNTGAACGGGSMTGASCN